MLDLWYVLCPGAVKTEVRCDVVQCVVRCVVQCVVHFLGHEFASPPPLSMFF